MGMMDTLRSYFGLPASERAVVLPPWPPGIDNFLPWITYNGSQYPLGLTQTLTGTVEEIESSGSGMVQGTFQRNPIVFACIQARMLLFSEARFQYQRMTGGRPGDLWGDASLSILERPEPGKVTGDLLARALVDADLYGNHFLALRTIDGAKRLKRLEPDWVTIVLGADSRDIDAELLGYLYHPGGRHSGLEPEVLQREQVAHFAPLPDPLARYRGMSWLTPVLRDIAGDSATTTHKVSYLQNGATVNLVVQTGVADIEKFKEWVRLFKEGHQGAANAGKTLFLTPGADAKPVGSNLQEMDYKAVQAAGEVRIAAAAGMHPVILGLSEGLQGSSLNQGNFMAARRLVADKTLRPLWRNFAGSLEVIVRPPSGSRLWYDDRHIPFLAEDVKEAAEVQGIESRSIRTLLDAGYLPATVQAAVVAQDWTLLKHSGLFSVQLQPPQPNGPEPEPKPLVPESPEPANGKPAAKPVAGAKA